MRDAQMLERADLQECIANSCNEFFGEIGERLFVVGKEIQPSESVQDRVDLLALDAEGTAVIVELKRGSNKLQMLQAISYAGMVSRWSVEDFREKLTGDQWDTLADFLEVDIDEINRNQRLLLVAEGYDYALLAGAEWLSQQHGIDIRCASITIAVDIDTDTEYLACAIVFPAPTLDGVANPRGGPRRRSPARWATWNEAIESIRNDDLREFARLEVVEGRETYLPKRGFHYRQDGRRRWSLHCRNETGYVWQRGRFSDDEAFWSQLLGDSANIKPVKRGSALSFNLNESAELSAFKQAVTVTLVRQEWLDDLLSEDMDQ